MRELNWSWPAAAAAILFAGVSGCKFRPSATNTYMAAISRANADAATLAGEEMSRSLVYMRAENQKAELLLPRLRAAEKNIAAQAAECRAQK